MTSLRTTAFLAASAGACWPALAQELPLQVACPTVAGLGCGIGRVEDGQGGRVLVLHADEAGLAGQRLSLERDGQGYALQPYAGRALVFEYEWPAEPPSGADPKLGGVHLLYLIAPVTTDAPKR